jgi:nucleoid DNA-binding protein
MADKKAGGAKKAITKSQFYQEVADATGLKKSEVVKVYDAIAGVLQKHLGPKGGGVVTLPGIAKISAVHTKASKGGEKRPNPFKPGEFIITKPKPARTKIKARGLKGFLESIARKM